MSPTVNGPQESASTRQQTREAFGRFIRLNRENYGWSQARLADKAGISRWYMNAIETGRRLPGMEILAGLARALDLPRWSVFKAAGLVAGDEPTKLPGVEAAIIAEPRLTAHQKEDLLLVYRAFKETA